MKLGHGPFDPHELSNKREEQRQQRTSSLLLRISEEDRGRERKRRREGERIKGKEDVVKTRAPKRLT